MLLLSEGQEGLLEWPPLECGVHFTAGQSREEEQNSSGLHSFLEKCGQAEKTLEPETIQVRTLGQGNARRTSMLSCSVKAR